MNKLIVTRNNILIEESDRYSWFPATYGFVNLNTKQDDLKLAADFYIHSALGKYIGNYEFQGLKTIVSDRLPTLLYYLSLYGISEDTHQLRRI